MFSVLCDDVEANRRGALCVRVEYAGVGIAPIENKKTVP